MNEKSGVSGVVRELLILTVATAIIGCAVFFFLVPSHAAVSSISGLAIVLTNFIPLSVSGITMILNVGLLILGFLLCGREFGYKTVYTSILLPVIIGVLERLFPDYTSLTGDATLDVICYVFTVSVGLAILFNRNASSGGLDIVAMIMNKYLHIELGKAVSIAGLCVALSAALAYDSKTVILSLLGSYVNGLVVDHFIFDQSIKRRVCIVSPKQEEIRQWILHDLGSGATIYEAIGAYHMTKHHEIITVVDRSEYPKLMEYLRKVDPHAFITVYNVRNMSFRAKSLPERDFSENTIA